MSTPDQPTTHVDPSLARLQRGYTALFALVDDFPEHRRDEPGACGEWSPRQILAHLSGWMVEAAARFAAIQAGDRANVQYDVDGDHAAFNRESVNARAALTWDETVDDLRSSFATFTTVAGALPAAALVADARYREWLDWLWKDNVEHMGQLCRFALL